MKRILTVILFSAIAFFILPSFFLIGENPQDPPRGKKTERHIKMMKIDESGKKTELDTVIYGNHVFVWQGDTVGQMNDFKWITKDYFKMDSVHRFDYKFDEKKGNDLIIIKKSGKGDDRIIMAPFPPEPPMLPHTPKVMMFRGQTNRNVIDLSDPGIISYDKKVRKDGTEKITIVRKQVNKNDLLPEDVMITPPQIDDVSFMGDSPKRVKTMRVIKSDEGTAKVFENEKVMHFQGQKGKSTFIGDDGKVIHIEEIDKDGEKQIEVKVEKKAEKENK